MVLTPHAVAGAAISTFFKLNPVTAFFAGFLSHFFLDLLPHWDYELKSAAKDEICPLNNDLIIGRDFYLDLIKIGFDALLGVVLALIFFSLGAGFSFWSVLAGALGGIFPDALQFLYMKWRKEPLIALQRTHLLFHPFRPIKDPVKGIIFYSLFILLLLILGGLNFFSL